MVKPATRISSLALVTLRILRLLAIHPLRVARAEDLDYHKKFCPVEATVDLSNAVRNSSGFLAESGHFFPEEVAKFIHGAWRGCICDLKPCLSVCSRPKKTGTGRIHEAGYYNYSLIPNVYTTNLTIDDAVALSREKWFNILVREPCPVTRWFHLHPKVNPTDEYYLLRNGSLFLPGMKTTSSDRLLGLNRFCLSLARNKSSYSPRVCLPEDDSDENDALEKLIYIGNIVAVPFLVATVIVYSVLPELKTIHGTTLRCYLCCLVIAYLGFAAIRIPEPGANAEMFCLFAAFTTYSSFLASFFWLNVMSYDMWWKFGSFGRSWSRRIQPDDGKKFLWYSIYAWGITAVMTAICIAMEFAPGIPADSLIRPRFGSQSCWFTEKSTVALYFFGPIGVTLASNVCFFVSTCIRMVQRNKNTNRRLNSRDSTRHDRNKQWFSLYTKLFVLMGINWTTEIISWLWEDPKELWYFTDMINALQGILIFVIFVCKKKIWHSLKERYGTNQTQATNVESTRMTMCIW